MVSTSFYRMSILDAFYNNSSLATSIISLLIAIPLLRWLYSRLPRSKLESLDGLLTDTKRLFYAAIWDGTLDDDEEVDEIQHEIWECVTVPAWWYRTLTVFAST